MRTVCYSLIIFCCGLILGAAATMAFSDKDTPKAEQQECIPVPEPDWDTFIVAVSYIESKGDDRAVGTKDDVGRLQITPILLKDANRIVGYEKYSLEDRTDPGKSVEIWNVIQDHYNPDHDFQLALKIWNPRAPLSYHRNIIAEYNKLIHL